MTIYLEPEEDPNDTAWGRAFNTRKQTYSQPLFDIPAMLRRVRPDLFPPLSADDSGSNGGGDLASNGQGKAAQDEKSMPAEALSGERYATASRQPSGTKGSASKGQSNQKTPEGRAAIEIPPSTETVGEVPGYSETGAFSWRKANDQLIYFACA